MSVNKKEENNFAFIDGQIASSLYKKITRANYRYLEDSKDKIKK